MRVLKYLQRLFFLLLVGIPLAGTAEEALPTLEVWTKGGERITYVLSDRPVATWSDMEVVITAAGLTVSYPLSELWKFTFGTQADGVASLRQEADGRMQMQEGMLHLSGFSAGMPVAVCSLDGRVAAMAAIGADGAATISIHTLATGIYVVKTGSITHKIIKK